MRNEPGLQLNKHKRHPGQRKLNCTFLSAVACISACESLLPELCMIKNLKLKGRNLDFIYLDFMMVSSSLMEIQQNTSLLCVCVDGGLHFIPLIKSRIKQHCKGLS